MGTNAKLTQEVMHSFNINASVANGIYGIIEIVPKLMFI